MLKFKGKKNNPIFIAEISANHNGSLAQARRLIKTAKKYGEEQVKIWRRSFDIPPPNGESLKDTAARVLPYFKDEIIPKLK